MNLYFTYLKEKSGLSILSEGHNFVSGRYCYWHKLDKHKEIKWKMWGNRTKTWKRVKISSAAGWQSTLGLLKGRGTLSYLYLIFTLPNCAVIFISMQTFWTAISSPNFSWSNTWIRNQISPWRHYKNYLTLKINSKPLKMTSLIAWRFQAEQP